MEREEKLVLEREARERRTTRQCERARPSSAGEVAAGGAPGCSSPDTVGETANVRVGGAHCPPALVCRKSTTEENPEAGAEGSAWEEPVPRPGRPPPRCLGLGARCGRATAALPT